MPKTEVRSGIITAIFALQTVFPLLAKAGFNELRSTKGGRVVFVRREVKAESKNPYEARDRYSVTWFGANSEKLCAFDSDLAPSTMSASGQILVLKHAGMEPVSFEVSHDVPGLHSTEELKNDRSLTDWALEVRSSDCRVSYSTASSSGWNHIALSDNGRWLLMEGFETLRSEIAVVDLQKNQDFEIRKVPRTSIAGILDDGSVLALRFLGRVAGQTTIEHDGHFIPIQKRRFQRLLWHPGSTDFQPAGEETQ